MSLATKRARWRCLALLLWACSDDQPEDEGRPDAAMQGDIDGSVSQLDAQAGLDGAAPLDAQPSASDSALEADTLAPSGDAAQASRCDFSLRPAQCVALGCRPLYAHELVIRVHCNYPRQYIGCYDETQGCDFVRVPGRFRSAFPRSDYASAFYFDEGDCRPSVWPSPIFAGSSHYGLGVTTCPNAQNGFTPAPGSCERLGSEDTCSAAEGCVPLYGRRVDETQRCLAAPSMAACRAALPACERPSSSLSAAPDGGTWQLLNDCLPAGWTSPSAAEDGGAPALCGVDGG
jgi:hypothetical protein